MSTFRPVLWLVFLASVTAGCRAGGRPADSADVIVRAGGTVVTVSDVQGQLDKMPPAGRDRYSTVERQREFLDKLIKTEVMAAEAKRLGYDRDPEVVEATKRAMVTKLLRERIGVGPKAGEITPEAIVRYYREHPAEFSRTEEARVTYIVVSQRDKAERALDEAKPTRDAESFRQVVFKHSEERDVQMTGGDVTFTGRGPSTHPEAVVAAAFSLTAPGELSPIIETPRGFYLLRLRQHVPAATRTLEESRERIVRLISDQLRDRRIATLVENIGKTIPVETFPDRLSRLQFASPPLASDKR